MKGFF